MTGFSSSDSSESDGDLDLGVTGVLTPGVLSLIGVVTPEVLSLIDTLRDFASFFLMGLFTSLQLVQSQTMPGGDQLAELGSFD